MKAMLDAIKKKRVGGDEPAQESHGEDGAKDLHGFVSCLSDEEKGQLKSILHADSQDTSGIEKGEPSSEEKGEIQVAMSEQNSPEASDEVNEAMVDHKAITAMDRGQKPRNLGERARMQAAQGLKQKGKI